MLLPIAHLPTAQQPNTHPPPSPATAQSAMRPPCPPWIDDQQPPKLPTDRHTPANNLHPQSLVNSRDLSSNTPTNTRVSVAPPIPKIPPNPPNPASDNPPNVNHSPSPISHDLVQAVLLSTIHYPLVFAKNQKPETQNCPTLIQKTSARIQLFSMLTHPQPLCILLINLTKVGRSGPAGSPQKTCRRFICLQAVVNA